MAISIPSCPFLAKSSWKSSKIKPTAFSLKATDYLYKEVFKGVSLTKAFLEVNLTKKGKSWNLEPQLTGEFDIHGITNSNSGSLGLTIKNVDNELDLSATASHLKGAFGINELNLENFTVTGVLSKRSKSLEINTEFNIGHSTFDFDGKVTSDSVGIYTSISSFNIDTLSNVFNEIYPAGLTLPDFDIDFKNTRLSFATAEMTLNNIKIPQGFNLASNISAYDHEINADALITSSGIKFDGSLGDLKFGPVDLVKTSLDFQLYKKSLHKPAKFEISGEAKIEGLTVDCGVYFEKDTTVTTVLYAILDASTFKLSNAIPAVKDSFADNLKFSKIGFIYASANTTTKNEGLDFTVQEGLQLMANLEEVPALTTLTGSKQVGLNFSAHFGSSTNISIAIPDTRIDLGHSVTTDPIKVQINLIPHPSFEVIFGMNVKIANQENPLHFDMVLDISALDAKGSVTMKNYWKNPFGIHGIKIGPEVALELEILYSQFVATGLPSGFGMAGGLVIADTTIQMAVKISENPTEEFLSGKLENLNPSQLINFATQLIDLNIQTVPNFFEIKDLEIYIAPAGVSIGTIQYEPGFSFKGDVVIAGKEIEMHTHISDTGIQGGGFIENWTLGPLEIRGEKGKNAKVNLDLTEEKQSFFFDAAFVFLGLEEGLYVDISNKGLDFKFEQNFFDELKFQIQGASSGKLEKPDSLDFKLSGEMQNDITTYLKTTVKDRIQDSIKTTDETIAAAQKKVEEARKGYEAVFNKANNELTKAQTAADGLLNKLTKKVADTKKLYKGKIEDAEQLLKSAKATYDGVLNKAQSAVNNTEATFNEGVRNAQSTLENARRTFNRGVQAAQDKLVNARRSYQNSVDAAKRNVDIASRKVDSINGFRHPYDKSKARAEFYAAGVIYADLLAGSGPNWVILKGLEKALDVAKTGSNYVAFDNAKKALHVAQTGAKSVAFDTARKGLQKVKEGTDYLAWKKAESALNTIKAKGLSMINEANHELNVIGHTAIYLAVDKAKAALRAVEEGSEFVAFNSAKTALEAARIGAKGVLRIGEFIASHSGDIIDIKSFTFKGSLKAIESGEFFKATLNVSIMSYDYNWKIDFNVKDVSKFIDNLFDKAWAELKSLA